LPRMRLFGWTLIGIGLLIAFGLPSLAVLESNGGVFSVWQIILPMLAGAFFMVVGRLVQPAYKARVRDR